MTYNPARLPFGIKFFNHLKIEGVEISIWLKVVEGAQNVVVAFVKMLCHAPRVSGQRCVA
jgi:hypothetical protein